jgi:transposase
MIAMKSLAQLDQLNLDANTKRRVADIVQSLLDQTQKEIHVQELKIQALTLELAHLRRKRPTPHSPAICMQDL